MYKDNKKAAISGLTKILKHTRKKGEFKASFSLLSANGSTALSVVGDTEEMVEMFSQAVTKQPDLIEIFTKVVTEYAKEGAAASTIINSDLSELFGFGSEN